MVSGAVKQVGNSHGSRRCSHLNSGEQRMIVHDGVCQEGFVDAAMANIECRSVIQCATPNNCCNQPIVLAVPKFVHTGHKWLCGWRCPRCFILFRGIGAAGRLRCIWRIRIPAIRGLLLRACHGCCREQKKCSRDYAQNSIPQTTASLPYNSHIGSTDCVQARKGCKAGKRIPRDIFHLPEGQSQGTFCFCNRTTRNCIFSLDTTRAGEQNPGNFSREFMVQGTATEKARVIPEKHEGGKRAVFAGMDRAMY